jgi:hypothetical protein
MENRSRVENNSKFNRNRKKRLQKSNLKAFFDVYPQKMPSNLKIGDSHYLANLDIVEVQGGGFSPTSHAKDKVMKRCHKVFTL